MCQLKKQNSCHSFIRMLQSESQGSKTRQAGDDGTCTDEVSTNFSVCMKLLIHFQHHGNMNRKATPRSGWRHNCSTSTPFLWRVLQKLHNSRAGLHPVLTICYGVRCKNWFNCHIQKIIIIISISSVVFHVHVRYSTRTYVYHVSSKLAASKIGTSTPLLQSRYARIKSAPILRTRSCKG